MKALLVMPVVFLLTGCAAAIPFGVGAAVGTIVTKHNDQPRPTPPPIDYSRRW